jgi:hypothetical protein
MIDSHLTCHTGSSHVLVYQLAWSHECSQIRVLVTWFDLAFIVLTLTNATMSCNNRWLLDTWVLPQRVVNCEGSRISCIVRQPPRPGGFCCYEEMRQQQTRNIVVRVGYFIRLHPSPYHVQSSPILFSRARCMQLACTSTNGVYGTQNAGRSRVSSIFLCVCI